MAYQQITMAVPGPDVFEEANMHRTLPIVLLFVLTARGGDSQNLPGVRWVKFQDPFERAFTIDVPQGWTVKGGLFRLGYSDVRPMLDMQSPDGSIRIRTGDVAIPSYAFPTQYHPREGEIDDLGAQAQMVYARYRNGRDFAGLYALTRFRTLCQSLTPEETNQASPVKEYVSGGADTSAGAILYRCDSGPGSRAAYVYARTTIARPIWQVGTLVSYLAPSEQVSLVRGILMHTSQSFQFNQQWLEYQKKMEADGLEYQKLRQQKRLGDLAREVRQVHARMQGMQHQVRAFQNQQNGQARQVESMGNILTGVTPAIDPLNGETLSVWTGPASGYWKNGQGTIVNSNGSPGAGFHQLQP